MKIALTFACHDCANTFTNVIDVMKDPGIIVTCPICRAQSYADLAPYPKDNLRDPLEVFKNMRGVAYPGEEIVVQDGWPKVIETTQPES